MCKRGEVMQKLTADYSENVKMLDGHFRVKENFDIIKKILAVGKDELTLYYIDGFVKDATMQKLMLSFVALEELPRGEEAAHSFLETKVAYVETELCESVETMTDMMLAGATVMLGSTFLDKAIIIDARTYPARETAEPENDRVMLGARDGFVETLIFNTALIRRRIRDTSLTMQYLSVGKSSHTDIVVCYMKGRAKEKWVNTITEKLKALKPDALAMGHQSLCECLMKNGWYNPFPKVRTTERPDNAAVHILEGSIVLLVDTSPEALILPTSLLDFVQETNDYYFPPLTGSFLRLVRQAIMFLTLFMCPIWYLLVRNPDIVPAWLAFTIPEETGKIPIIAQILIGEFVVDGLRMASMNTPNMLSNSLSVVGGLILGDFAIDIGWLIPEVILYIAFVSIAGFSQRNYELAYAFKFLRLMILILTAIFNIWGFVAGVILTIVLIATNKTVLGTRSYLYPLIPFSGKALLSLIFRTKKQDI